MYVLILASTGAVVLLVIDVLLLVLFNIDSTSRETEKAPFSRCGIL